MKYLYGLSIQGIQSYIFATNKLKEIIGASQLVKELPRRIIEEILDSKLDDDKVLIDAAGNFKYEFKSKDHCDLVFRCIPMRFQQLAGDIVVSQAVVETNKLTTENINDLENLLKAQRNKPSLLKGLASMAMFKNPKTGKPTVDKDGPDYLDFNQKKKRVEYKNGNAISPFQNNANLMDNIENMSVDNESWIGIIHADGNSLGKKVIALGDRINSEGLDVKTTFRDFSRKLQEATELAVLRAFDEVVISKTAGAKQTPFRPIIIGGDDVTVVTRGDLALDFTDRFLCYFEEETKRHLGYLEEFKDGLTACAGIAYTKSHYPFHYGVDLAEDLCKQAKKDAKQLKNELAPSCIMFHKMYSSYVREWDEIAKMELNSGGVNLANGPYYVHETANRYTVKDLKSYAELLAQDESPKSNIRKWLTELGKDSIRAKDLMRRTKETTGKTYWRDLDLDSTLIDNSTSTHLYDALVIEDLNY